MMAVASLILSIVAVAIAATSVYFTRQSAVAHSGRWNEDKIDRGKASWTLRQEPDAFPTSLNLPTDVTYILRNDGPGVAYGVEVATCNGLENKRLGVVRAEDVVKLEFLAALDDNADAVRVVWTDSRGPQRQTVHLN